MTYPNLLHLPRLFIIAVCGLTALAAWAASGPLYRDGFATGDTKGWTLQPPINARGPIAANGTWKADDNAFVATGTAAPWTIQTGGDASWMDYTLSAAVTIRKPGPKADYPIFDGEYDRYLPREFYPPYCQHPGQLRYRYYAGEFDWGSEAALYFRYQDRNACYRVQLSTEYQEMILWHGTGGYLQVVPCKLQAGKTYQVEVKAQGAHIQISLDGAKKIDYWHECLPTMSGGIGLAAYHSTVAFKNVQVTSLPATMQATPAHQPRFTSRTWRTQRWIFDGEEPIALMEKNESDYGAKGFILHFTKLRPGYRPSYYIPVFVVKDNAVYSEMVGTVKDIKTTGEGSDRFGFAFDEVLPDKSLTAKHTDALTFDRTRGTYRHDLTTKITFTKDQKITSLEYADAFTFNNHAPGRSVKYGWLASRDDWGIYTGPNGKIYRHPISKALLLGEGWYCGPSPSVWMLYPSRGVVPAFEHLEPADPTWIIVCHWGHDYHNAVRWEQGRNFKANDQYIIRYALAGYTMDEGERYFQRSEINPLHAKIEETNKYLVGSTVPSLYAFPVCEPAGTTFDELQSARNPFTGWHYIGKYTVDREVGRTDHYSLRLDGAAKVSGQFYHNMIDNYSDRYLCTFWLKTKGVQGKLTAKFKYAYGEKPCDTINLPITGDTDWQEISFITSVPKMTKDNSDSSELVIQNDGAGTVWFDDFSVRSLGDDEKVIEHIPGK
ncbi:MAG: family 16 glycoside hydrolase [Armatimonadota bacterium]